MFGKKGLLRGKGDAEARMLLGGVGHSEATLIFGALLPGMFGFRSCVFPAVFPPHAKLGAVQLMRR